MVQRPPCFLQIMFLIFFRSCHVLWSLLKFAQVSATCHSSGCTSNSAETCTMTGKECEPVDSDIEATLFSCSHCVPFNQDCLAFDLSKGHWKEALQVKELNQAEDTPVGFDKAAQEVNMKCASRHKGINLVCMTNNITVTVSALVSV